MSDNSDSDQDEYEPYTNPASNHPSGPGGLPGGGGGGHPSSAGGPEGGAGGGGAGLVVPALGGDLVAGESGLARKRKIQRACDVCRRRKQRCNGFEMPDHRCSSCIASELPCTYVEGSKKRAAPKGYVESLESRLAKTEQMLSQLRPGVDLAAELGDPLDKSQFAARRRASKAKEKQLEQQKQQQQQHLPPDNRHLHPSSSAHDSSVPYYPPHPSSSSSAYFPPNRQQPGSYPPHMSHENSQYYAPPDPNRRSPPYYPEVQGQPSSHRLFPIPGQPFSSQSPYLGQQQHHPLPPNALGRPSPSSMPPPLTVPSPNGPSPLHNNGYANQIVGIASPYANGDGNRLPPPPPQLHRVASDSSYEGGSSSSYPPPPPPITIAGISPSTSGPLYVPPGHQLARGQSDGGESGSSSSRSRTVTAVKGEEPSKDHHDDEADLKSFVQLNHRDEQLFKRFMGKSSGLPLLFSALGFKYGNQPNRYGQEIKLHRTTSRASYWRIPRWESTPQNSGLSPEEGGPPQSPALAAMMSSNPFASWPDPALAMRLIEAYFERVNVLLPLLHKPSFYKQYQEQLYNADPGFARICLLVFAVGSSYCDDPRVRFPREDGGTHGIDSSGWVFFHAFGRMVRHRLAPTELCDLQVSVLLVQFLRHSSQPGSCWLLVGEGLRYAQDVGVHRNGVQRSSDPLENELFKRGFWCLYLLDRELSAFMGRPLTLQEEDFDVGLPAECDDEFWAPADPLLAFKQPEGQPSKLAAFVHQIGLARILSKALSQLYTIQPPHLRKTEPAEIVKDLDSQLGIWLASVPEHLRWDPSRPDSIFWRQSCHLYLDYYLVTTYVHRPFLPSPQNPIPASAESFVTAINSANSAAHVMDSYWQKTNEVQPFVFHSAYTAALILLIGVWGGKSTGLESDPAISMQGVERCVFSLAEAERRFFGIGRARDAISVLSAPRVDYLAESLARRKAREEKVNSQDMFRLPTVPNEGSFQVAARSPLPDKASRFPTTSERSSSNPPTPRSTSNGNGPLPLPPPHPSHQQAALPHHMQSPSNHQNPLAYGSPQNSAPSPYQPNFSPSSEPTPPDFFQVGGGSFLGVFPDFFAAETDPAMSLFPSSGGGDYWIADDLFSNQGLTSNNGGGPVGNGGGAGGGLVDHSGGTGAGGGDETSNGGGEEWGAST